VTAPWFCCAIRAESIDPPGLGNHPTAGFRINGHRGSNIDGRTTRHTGYLISPTIRKRIEEANSWIKGVAGMNRAPLRGLPRMGGAFRFRTAAYNLIRMPGLLATG
jgi:hypothetical protein